MGYCGLMLLRNFQKILEKVKIFEGAASIEDTLCYSNYTRPNTTSLLSAVICRVIWRWDYGFSCCLRNLMCVCVYKWCGMLTPPNSPLAINGHLKFRSKCTARNQSTGSNSTGSTNGIPLEDTIFQRKCKTEAILLWQVYLWRIQSPKIKVYLWRITEDSCCLRTLRVYLREVVKSGNTLPFFPLLSNRPWVFFVTRCFIALSVYLRRIGFTRTALSFFSMNLQTKPYLD